MIIIECKIVDKRKKVRRNACRISGKICAGEIGSEGRGRGYFCWKSSRFLTELSVDIKMFSRRGIVRARPASRISTQLIRSCAAEHANTSTTPLALTFFPFILLPWFTTRGLSSPIHKKSQKQRQYNSALSFSKLIERSISCIFNSIAWRENKTCQKSGFSEPVLGLMEPEIVTCALRQHR